jgi:hypothetical protein
MKKSFWVPVLLVVLATSLVLAGCGETVAPKKVDPHKPGIEEYGGGTTQGIAAARLGDLQFTLNGVRCEPGSDLAKPAAGKRWLVFDVALENKGFESEVISSLGLFSLYGADSRPKTFVPVPNLKGSLDGKLEAGRKISGEIAFEVDEEETEWEFVFEVFRIGKATCNVTADTIK